MCGRYAAFRSVEEIRRLFVTTNSAYPSPGSSAITLAGFAAADAERLRLLLERVATNFKAERSDAKAA